MADWSEILKKDCTAKEVKTIHKTSDGSEFSTFEDAEIHELFLVFKQMLKLKVNQEEVFKTLLKENKSKIAKILNLDQNSFWTSVRGNQKIIPLSDQPQNPFGPIVKY